MSMNRAQIVTELTKAFGTDASSISSNLIGDWQARMPNTAIYALNNVHSMFAKLIEHAGVVNPDAEQVEYWTEVYGIFKNIVPLATVAQPMAARKRFGADYVAPVFVANVEVAKVAVEAAVEVVKAKTVVKRVTPKTVKAQDYSDQFA